MCGAVNRCFFFRSISAKNAIINNKYASHVFIEVLGIAGVVYPVIRRCIENKIEYPQFFDTLCMYKNIMQGGKRIKENDHDGRYAKQTQWRPE